MMANHKTLRMLTACGIVTRHFEGGDILEIMLFSLLVLGIKGFLVMASYNYLIPKLLVSVNPKFTESQFRPLTIWEAVLMIILFSNLFCRW